MLFLDNKKKNVKGLETVLGALPFNGDVVFKLANVTEDKTGYSEDGLRKNCRISVPATYTVHVNKTGESHKVIFDPQGLLLQNGFNLSELFFKPEFTSAFKTVSSREEAAFLYFHPACGDSPFRYKSQKKIKWEVEDKQKEAEDDNERITARFRAIEYVEKAEATELLLVAKGMTFQGVLKDKSKGEIKNFLLKQAELNPSEFMQTVELSTTTFRGKLSHAIDKGIIELKRENGITKWYWQDGSHIINCNNNQDAFDLLLNVMQENPKLLVERMNEQSESASLEERLKEAQSATWEDKVNALVTAEQIEFDRSKKTWFSVIDGELGTELTQLENPKAPKQSLINVLNNGDSDYKGLRTAITKLFNGNNT